MKLLLLEKFIQIAFYIGNRRKGKFIQKMTKKQVQLFRNKPQAYIDSFKKQLI